MLVAFAEASHRSVLDLDMAVARASREKEGLAWR
jgi:hypothetical protein